MIEANWGGGLLGGALIGIAAVSLLALNGRIAGVSGMLATLAPPRSDRDMPWKLAFLAGLVAGPLLYELGGATVALHLQAHGVWLLVAGVLVGFGTRVGAGCTSGHGVCGLARRSPRSLAATVIFMSVAILTVYVTRQVLA